MSYYLNTLKKKLYLILLVFITILSLYIGKLIFSSLNQFPQINGVIIPEPKALSDFRVLDHHNNNFENRHLLGKWHFVTYGYTNCPDVCPTTLNVLSHLIDRINADKKYSDVEVLFYSIDPERDTAEQLSSYMPFFNDNFIGLTYTKEMEETARKLEKSLGMISILKPTENEEEKSIYGNYRVSHGFMLYLLNPLGQLQAVLRPDKGKAGENYFVEENVLKDYIAVRNYFG